MMNPREANVGHNGAYNGAEVPSDALHDALKVMGLEGLNPCSIADEFRSPLIRLAPSWAAAISNSTLISRRSDLRRFSSWCNDQGKAPFSSDAALADLMGRHLGFIGQCFAPGTTKRIGSNLTALAKGVGSYTAANEAQESKDQATRAAQKMLRARGIQRNKTHLTVPQIRDLRKRIVDDTSSSLLAIRDLAILDTATDLLASRIEIVRMRLQDFDLSQNTMRFPGLRGDQVDRESVFTISPRTAASIGVWLSASGIRDLNTMDAGPTPLFSGIMNDGKIRIRSDGFPEPMSGRTVARAIQRYAASLNIPDVTGNSLRRSMAHALYEAGVPEREIVKKGRWSSLELMHRYVGLSTPISGAVGLVF
jgi:integrase